MACSLRGSILSDRSGWYNLGFWTSESASYTEAASRLADVHGKAARLKPGMTILDIGAGSGASSTYWINQIAPLRVDIVEPRKGVRQELARIAAKFAEIGDIFTTSIEDVEQLNAPYDAIIAVDCAYHFKSAEVLPQLAKKELTNGGHLAFTTIVAPNDQSYTYVLALAGVKKASVVSEATWQHLFSHEKLTNITATDLTTEVWGGYRQHLKGLGVTPWLHPKWWKFALTAQMLAMLQALGYRYMLFSAEN